SIGSFEECSSYGRRNCTASSRNAGFSFDLRYLLVSVLRDAIFNCVLFDSAGKGPLDPSLDVLPYIPRSLCTSKRNGTTYGAMRNHLLHRENRQPTTMPSGNFDLCNCSWLL